jgi:hypothetical protein
MRIMRRTERSETGAEAGSEVIGAFAGRSRGLTSPEGRGRLGEAERVRDYALTK